MQVDERSFEKMSTVGQHPEKTWWSTSKGFAIRIVDNSLFSSNSKSFIIFQIQTGDHLNHIDSSRRYVKSNTLISDQDLMSTISA